MVSSLVVGIWAARYLGPTQFGELTYVTIFPTVLISFAGLGIANLIITELVRKNAYSEADILGTGFVLRLVSGIVCFMLVYLAGHILHYKEPSVRYMIFFTSFVLISQVFEVFDFYFQAKTKSKQSVKAKMIALSVSIALRLFFLINHYSIVSFALLVLVETVISAIMMIILYCQEEGSNLREWKFNKDIASYLLKASWPIMISEFFIFVYMRVNQLMLNNMVNSAELGKFSAALRLSEVWFFIAVAVTSSFYPSILKLKEKDEVQFLEKYQQLISLLAFVSIAISLLTTVFAKLGVRMLYGDAYEGVAQVLVVHIWCGVFVFLGVSVGNLFILYNKQQLVIYKTIVGALMSVGLNYLLIPSFGAVGASIASLCAYIVSSYLSNYFFTGSKFIFLLQTTAIVDAIKMKPLKQIWIMAHKKN